MKKQYKHSNGIRIYYGIFLLIAILLLFNNLINSNFNNKIKFSINNTADNLRYLFKDGIYNYFSTLKGNYITIEKLSEENSLLKEQLAYASQNDVANKLLAARLEDLKLALNIKGMYNVSKITTTTISNNGIRYPNQTFVINLGSSNDVKNNTLVVSLNGIIGYIKDTYNNYSIIISPINTDFKISAKGSISKINIIVSGNNSLNPDVKIYSGDQNLQENELIVTSGLEGYFPPNIPIGTTYQDSEGNWKINLLDKLDKLEYVYLVE